MKKNAELPKLKLSSELMEKVTKAIRVLNDNEAELEIKLPEFRRMALKYFSESILREGLKIEFKP